MAQQNYGNPVGFYLSVATLPTMGILVVATALKEMVIAVGLASEEVFRGDRLPLLKKPTSSTASVSASVTPPTSVLTPH